MSEHNSSSKHSWWHTLPGMLTGLAAVIGAVTGLVVGLHQIGVFTNEAENDRPKPRDSNSNGRSSVQGFRVVEANLKADPFNYTGPCPVIITFTGRVSVAGGDGVVSYKFLRSDGASAPIRSLAFDGPGSKPVETTWRLGGSGRTFSGWQAIKIFDPHDIVSNKAHFKINCR